MDPGEKAVAELTEKTKLFGQESPGFQISEHLGNRGKEYMSIAVGQSPCVF